jgi:hypothetical protein
MPADQAAAPWSQERKAFRDFISRRATPSFARRKASLDGTGDQLI